MLESGNVVNQGVHRLQFSNPSLKMLNLPIPILADTDFFFLSELLLNRARKLSSWQQWGQYC